MSLESLTEWILTQMNQDLVRVRKASFSAEARLRADNWCTERFELSNTTSATLGLDGECRVGRGP